ncbi:hypothetical protein PV767_18285 [Stenotrophomonas rhizophila]|uniref:hypothetical protein n=1 Tax=Stenotrophomonas sp. AS2 TaxID=3029192 RepID=UPI003B771085
MTVPTTSNAPIALTARTVPLPPTTPINPIISTVLADPTIAHASAASAASAASTVSTPETSATAQAFRFTVDISIAVAMTRRPSVAFPLRTSPLSKGGHGWVGGTMSAMDGAT